MIVRILGEGQYRLPDTAADELNAIDDRLEQAVRDNDAQEFTVQLLTLVDAVRSLGQAVPHDELLPSDAVVPDPDTSLHEARRLLSDEGLIPD